MNEEIIYKVVKKLIGDIKPKGCSSRDPQIFENMKIMCSVVDNLLTDIDDVAYLNKDSKEHSVKKIADYATKFYNKLGIKE